MKDVVSRLYPNETPHFIGDLMSHAGPAFLCVAYFYSDAPVKKGDIGNYSLLLLCGLVENIDRGIRNILCDLLSEVDWELTASNDVMW